MNKAINDFSASWQVDTLGVKPAFSQYLDFLNSLDNVALDFKARPGISYSVRARDSAQKKRELFVLVDVVDDEPDNRWLSVCFYADMISDPEELGDFVPEGLLGENALCFNLDENDPKMQEYILGRIREAQVAASKDA